MKKILKICASVLFGFAFILVVTSCKPKEPTPIDPPLQTFEDGTYTIEFPPMA